MARRRRRGATKPNASAARKRRRTGRRSKTTTNLPGVLRTLTTLTSYVKVPDAKDTGWLDKLTTLVSYGVVALRLWVKVFGVNKLGDAESIPLGAVQVIPIGPDELVSNSTIVTPQVYRAEEAVGTPTLYTSPACSFRQCRLRSLQVRIRPAAKISERAGRIAACIIPFSVSEFANAFGGSYQPWMSLGFNDIQRMPGAVVAPFDKGITLSYSPRSSEVAHLWQNIGQVNAPSSDSRVAGASPLCMLVVGYMDVAGNKPVVSDLYGPQESVSDIEIRSSLSLREFGTSWIRRFLSPVLDADLVSVGVAGYVGQRLVPSHLFSQDEGVLTLGRHILGERILSNLGSASLRVLPPFQTDHDRQEDGSSPASGSLAEML